MIGNWIKLFDGCPDDGVKMCVVFVKWIFKRVNATQWVSENEDIAISEVWSIDEDLF